MNHAMNHGAEKLSVAEAVSALVDGETDHAAAATVSALWRDDAELRARWHGYQLIGDAMRSDELAGSGRDADFLKRLREKLDAEPVVLAPQRAPARAPASQPAVASRARRWATPAAMAAGFVMVAGAVLVTRSPNEAPAVQLAAQATKPSTVQATPVAPVGVASNGVSSLSAPALTVAAANSASPSASNAQEAAVPFQGVLLRDARMQQYFAAHQQFGGSTALGSTSTFLRNATFETPSAQAGSR